MALRPASWRHAEVELKKILRDPTEVLARAVQPVLWLVVFGEVFSRVRGIPTGNVSYLAFMTPGILAQSVLFAAIFYGIAYRLGARPRHRSQAAGESRIPQFVYCRQSYFRRVSRRDTGGSDFFLLR